MRDWYWSAKSSYFLWGKSEKNKVSKWGQLDKNYFSRLSRWAETSRWWDRKVITMQVKSLITIFVGFFLCLRESLSQVVFPDVSAVTAPPAFTTAAYFFGDTVVPYIQTSKWKNADFYFETVFIRNSLKMSAFAWTAEDVRLLTDFRPPTVLVRSTFGSFP